MPRRSGYPQESAGRWCCGEWIPTIGAAPLLTWRHEWKHLMLHGDPTIPPSDDPGRIRLTVTATAYIGELEKLCAQLAEQAVNLGDRIDDLEVQLAAARHPSGSET